MKDPLKRSSAADTCPNPWKYLFSLESFSPLALSGSAARMRACGLSRPKAHGQNRGLCIGRGRKSALCIGFGREPGPFPPRREAHARLLSQKASSRARLRFEAPQGGFRTYTQSRFLAGTYTQSPILSTDHGCEGLADFVHGPWLRGARRRTFSPLTLPFEKVQALVNHEHLPSRGSEGVHASILWWRIGGSNP